MAGEKRTKDQEMAQRMKANHEERRSGRCPSCDNIIPNGLFEPARNLQHAMTCPGRSGDKRKGSGGHSVFQGHPGITR